MKILAIFSSYVHKMDRESCSGSADKAVGLEKKLNLKIFETRRINPGSKYTVI